MTDLSTTTLLILTGTGFLAGFVDSIAGGGGLITLPALLTTGMPPTLALGTFLFGQSVHFKIGLCMGIGQILGATLGSHLVILKGTRFVRIFFLTVVGATLIKMFASLYF